MSIDDLQLEFQRYGRNKATVVNKTYINSGEYRRKFDKITDNPEINRSLYGLAKRMLFHRSGTLFEDMCWVDGDNGRLVALAKEERLEERIAYPESLKKLIAGRQSLITMHTHPHSMPPSASDFNSMFKHDYRIALVLCHNGIVFQYMAAEAVNERLYSMYIQRFMADGISEYEAQLRALERLRDTYAIEFWEV